MPFSEAKKKLKFLISRFVFDLFTSGAAGGAGVSTSRIISVARIIPSACCSCKVMHRQEPLSSSLVTTSQEAAHSPLRWELWGDKTSSASIFPDMVSGASLSAWVGSQLSTCWSMVPTWLISILVTCPCLWPPMVEHSTLLYAAVSWG